MLRKSPAPPTLTCCTQTQGSVSSKKGGPVSWSKVAKKSLISLIKDKCSSRFSGWHWRHAIDGSWLHTHPNSGALPIFKNLSKSFPWVPDYGSFSHKEQK